MADNYWAQLVTLTELPRYPKQGPFGQKEGALIGNREGYLVAIGPGKSDEGRSTVSIMLRFKDVEQSPALQFAVETSPAVLASLEVAELSKQQKKALQIGKDFLLWNWVYSFGKPKGEKVAALAKALVEAVKPVAPSFDGRCEVCHTSSTPEITLLNNVPGYFCGGCQQ